MASLRRLRPPPPTVEHTWRGVGASRGLAQGRRDCTKRGQRRGTVPNCGRHAVRRQQGGSRGGNNSDRKGAETDPRREVARDIPPPAKKARSRLIKRSGPENTGPLRHPRKGRDMRTKPEGGEGVRDGGTSCRVTETGEVVGRLVDQAQELGTRKQLPCLKGPSEK